MTPSDKKSDAQLAGLPAWLYPAGFWVAVVSLAAGVLFPDLSFIGVISVGLIPVLAAIWVAIGAWNRDRRLSYAALAALGGLVLVFVVKQFIR